MARLSYADSSLAYFREGWAAWHKQRPTSAVAVEESLRGAGLERGVRSSTRMISWRTRKHPKRRRTMCATPLP